MDYRGTRTLDSTGHREFTKLSVNYSSDMFPSQKGIVLVGAGIVLNWQCIQAYVVDAFTQYAASGAYQCRSVGASLLTATCMSVQHWRQ